ncbi:hypothetical protein RI543_001709 [Arxiozyma heterogenica]|uniref:BZIP domain-containing protein n=1 Tax=Arxiozyma heterogenica TaxID=278026 RepID=A0AAN8A7E0_9SACH|nr:hypothetical protein RI543_001709 [Kazachstania heterogenica]
MSTLTTSSKRSLDDALSSNLPINSTISNNIISSDIIDNNNSGNNDTVTTTTRSKKPASKKSKQLDPEARLKRTQQNRAAQRAFRERKEKKMRELENKVSKLTEIQKQNEIESNFLRDQLNLLLLELKKYRPTTDNDLKVLNYLSQHNNNNNNNNNNNKDSVFSSSSSSPSPPSPHPSKSTIKTSDINNNNNNDDDNNNNSSSSGSSNSSSNNTIPTGTITVNTPDNSSSWLDKLLSDNDLFTQQLFDNNNNNNNNSNSNKLNISNNNSPSPLFFSNKYNDNQIIPHSTKVNHSNNISTNSNSPNKDPLSSDALLDFDNQFDEQVANFCVKMNQACGTKTNPIPKNKSSAFSGSSISTNTPFTDSVITNSPLSSTSLSFVSTPSTFSNAMMNNNINNIKTNNDITASVPFLNYAKNLDINPFEIDTNKSVDSPQLTVCSTDTSTSSNHLHNTFNSTSTDDHIKDKDGRSTFDLQFLSNDFEIPFINADLAFPNINNDNEVFFRDTNPLKGTNTNNILDDFIDEEENVIYDNGIKIKQKLPTTLFNEVPYTVQLATSNNVSTTIKDATKSDSVVNDDNDDDAEDGDPQVVPSKDDKMLKCSEIWDRITTHPKYSELDIDGLCAELMAKAKCSDRGVVVDADIVQDALTKHMQ